MNEHFPFVIRKFPNFTSLEIKLDIQYAGFIDMIFILKNISDGISWEVNETATTKKNRF